MRMIRIGVGIWLSLLTIGPLPGQPLPANPTRIIEGSQEAAYLGRSVASAGDVNGDGYFDVIVGARGYDTFTGRAWVYLGSPAGLSDTPAWTVPGEQIGGRSGDPVACAGDVNGDGYDDVLIGSAYHDNTETDAGRASLFLGSSSGLRLQADWSAEGGQTGELFGIAIAAAGDVNGDGYGDVIVGASGYRNGELGEGRALLYLGSAAGLSRDPSWVVEGNHVGARFGNSLASAGDVNADGFDDVIVGAESYSGGETWEGRVFLYLGSAGGLAQEPAWAVESDQADAKFGTKVASAGDVNGDGHDDVIVGAVYYDNVEHDEGGAFLFLGTESALSSTSAWAAEGNQDFASFGHSVASVGDTNGDGYDDVAVGAVLFDEDLPDQGRVVVYLGSPTGLSNNPAWSADGQQIQGQFGYSVSSAGDVNGDGYDDLIVGADRHDGSELDGGAAFVYLGMGSTAGSAPVPPDEAAGRSAIEGRNRPQDIEIE